MLKSQLRCIAQMLPVIAAAAAPTAMARGGQRRSFCRFAAAPRRPLKQQLLRRGREGGRSYGSGQQESARPGSGQQERVWPCQWAEVERGVCRRGSQESRGRRRCGRKMCGCGRLRGIREMVKRCVGPARGRVSIAPGGLCLVVFIRFILNVFLFYIPKKNLSHILCGANFVFYIFFFLFLFFIIV